MHRTRIRHDPFNRQPYPWGREDAELLAHYRRLGEIRREHAVFADGEFRIETAQGGVLVYVREGRGERLTVAVNAGTCDVGYPLRGAHRDLISGKIYDGMLRRGEALILQAEKTKKEKR